MQEDGGEWIISRLGPFTSYGGYDWWQFSGHDAFNFSRVLEKEKKVTGVDTTNFSVCSLGFRV